MSIENCANCKAPVDVDRDPESQVEVGNMRRMTHTETICASCRLVLLERQEIADAAACLHEERSTS